MRVVPEIGVLLIQMPASKYGGLPVAGTNYKDEACYGTVLEVNPDDTEAQRFKGKTVYFKLFKADCEVTSDSNKKIALISINEILGSSDAEDAAA
jgi:hypothetical protein